MRPALNIWNIVLSLFDLILTYSSILSDGNVTVTVPASPAQSPFLLPSASFRYAAHPLMSTTVVEEKIRFNDSSSFLSRSCSFRNIPNKFHDPSSLPSNSSALGVSILQSPLMMDTSQVKASVSSEATTTAEYTVLTTDTGVEPVEPVERFPATHKTPPTVHATSVHAPEAAVADSTVAAAFPPQGGSRPGAAPTLRAKMQLLSVVRRAAGRKARSVPGSGSSTVSKSSRNSWSSTAKEQGADHLPLYPEEREEASQGNATTSLKVSRGKTVVCPVCCG